jgi:superfamily II DNA or RNA helicase
VEFAGTLRPDPEDAVAAMLPHDVGVLCAPTAFGKTVTGAA